jgi:hypothetical protein
LVEGGDIRHCAAHGVPACISLAIGGAVYLFARPVRVELLPAAWHHPIGPLTAHAGFAASLPTLAHAFALPLLTLACLRPGSARRAAAICAAWALVDTAFEATQHPTVAAQLARHGAPAAWLPAGTCDLADIAAALVGALLAFALAMNITEHRDT